MNSVGEEFRHKLPRLAANVALALAFGAAGALFLVIPTGATESVGFYSWLVLTLVGGAFLIRALVDVLTIGDKSVELVLVHLGIRQRRSKRRMAKDAVGIIATMLATAAIAPLFETLGPAGTTLHTIATAVALGVILLFVYDIARTFYEILKEKTAAEAGHLEPKQVDEVH
jgi:putative exporter of polyketide antibiotics